LAIVSTFVFFVFVYPAIVSQNSNKRVVLLFYMKIVISPVKTRVFSR